MVQITAEAEPESASRQSKAQHKAFCFITTLLTSFLRNKGRESARDGTPKDRNPCSLQGLLRKKGRNLHSAPSGGSYGRSPPGMKWLAMQALSSWMASKPTLNRPCAFISTVTQACAAAGSSGGLEPAAATVV